MTPERLDHTAIAVRDLDEALLRYQRLLGIQSSERARVPSQNVEVAFLRIGDTKLELISPTNPDTGVARFLAKHGEGLHHIGILVSDIGQELNRLNAEGVRLIDREPRPGLHGLIAFVHPTATGGVLIELIQPN